MRAATKKNSVEADVLGVVRFTWARDTFFVNDAKMKKEGQERKSRKYGQVEKPHFDRCHVSDGNNAHSALGRHRCRDSLEMSDKTKKSNVENDS